VKYEIFFQEYHGMWHTTDFPGKVEEVFNAYEEVEALQQVFKPTEGQIQHYIRAKILQHSNRRAIPETARAEVLYEPDSIDINMNVWLLRIDDKERFVEAFRQWMLYDLIWLEEHRGADDGTYDYYPDAWDVAHQIAKALGMKEEYNRARQKLLDTTAYGPNRPDYIGEDLIRAWEVEPSV